VVISNGQGDVQRGIPIVVRPEDGVIVKVSVEEHVL
jgi:hypothetical protein